MGLTQERVAQLSGLSCATINQIENGTVKDLSVIRSARLLAVLGLSFHVNAARPKVTSTRGHASPLILAAQTASVSYGTNLEPAMLEDAVLSGEVQPAWTPHLNTLLEEAPINLLARMVDELHVRHAIDRASLWSNLRTLADKLCSRRDIWARGPIS
jgi:transcriptional regulator with XRE-family HTH domain